MDSSDIYYSDNSQLMDDNNTEWIGNTVLIENQDITWQEDGPEITVDYSETANDINKTLTENDGYLTADNNESITDASAYYSMLESNCNDEPEEDYSTPDNPKCYVKVAIDKEESILPDITKREIIDEEYNTEPIININADNADDQVILYRMEGSDELYAVQLADDGNGNLQKYKYRVRQNDDGQFEAIPGSIEIEKADENDLLLQPSNPEPEPDQELDDSQHHDQKPNPETLALINQQISEAIETPEVDNNFYSVQSFVSNINPDDYLLQNSYQESEEEYQTVDGIHVTGDSLENGEIDQNSQGETVEETEFVNTDSIFPEEEEEEEEENDDDDDDDVEDNSESEYEVEELDEAFQDDNINDLYEVVENTQILQKSNIDNTKLNSEPDNRNVTLFRDDKHLSYLVIKAKEKENVILRTNNFTNSNLRSILKTSYPGKLKTSTPKPEKSNLPAIISKPTKETPPVNNTVLKPRQPRKQTIKPVDRAGSEIIVQPLVYSLHDNSIPFLVPVKKKRVVDEVLQVSDESDPEFTIKPIKKKKKTKHGKRGRPRNVEITIVDTDDDTEDDEESDASVIEVTDQEIVSDNGNNNEEEEQSEDETLKETNENIKNAEESENAVPDKQLDVKPSLEKPRKSLGLKKNKCPHCPKTFPRLITLKKHMNIHSTRRSLRSRANNSESNNPENKPDEVKKETEKPRQFNCLKCKLKFLTESQYKRHQTIHFAKNPIKKQLSPIRKPDKQILISQKHLRSNNKTENKLTQRLSQMKKSVVDNKTKEIFKCEYCGQQFGTRTLLIVHRNSHKTFPCPNCKTTFTAKLLLDDHLRKNCVKISPKKAKKFSPKRINSKCDICSQIFPTPKSLLIHKNITHKPQRIPTLERKPPIVKTSVKTKGAHGGVPPSLKMQQALNKLNKMKS